jgi:CRP-like cAMP-binding protein
VLSEEELLAVVEGLALHTFEPGDVIVTEGEPGASLFILTTGEAKVFVRSPSGRDMEVAQLSEGDFFGEVSCLSGRPRSATVTAAGLCELLELDKQTLDTIAADHPRVREQLEASYIRRASSPEAAAVRATDLSNAGDQRKAIEVLEAHFGESRWDPRMRLRLADVLLKAGKQEDAVLILVGLADDLAREGFAAKAIAILKKIEKIQRRHVEEVRLAPLSKTEPAPEPAPTPRRAAADSSARSSQGFQSWLVDLVRETVKGSRPDTPDPEAAPKVLSRYGPGLAASPLFEGLSEDELLALIRGLRLVACRAGDIVVSEGEPGASIFILASGSVKVTVRSPEGRNVALCLLREGAFFGEMATLSGQPRCATVVAAGPCELLELDKLALDGIAKTNPRVLEVLEEYHVRRSNSPEAAKLRSGQSIS